MHLLPISAMPDAPADARSAGFRRVPAAQGVSATRPFSAWLRAAVLPMVVLAAALGAPATAADGPDVVEVRPGDTFSSIAGRYTGNPGTWRKMYRPGLSNLPNPNMIAVGMRLERATDARGEPYLRVVSGTASAAASQAPSASPPAPAAVAPSTTARAPAPQAEAAPTPAPAVPPAASDTMVIGVLPNIPAPTLLAQYERVRRYLERVDGRKVRVVVPANFKEFFDSTMKGEFDLAVAAPHFARVAQVDRNMAPLVTYQPRINALFVAPADSKIAGPRDARERAIAFANPQSLVAMYGMQWLKQAGMEPNADFEPKPARTDLGVGRMLLSGDAVAAIMSNGEFRALPADESGRLRVVEVFQRIPNFIVVAHPRLDRARQAALKTHLKNFLTDADEGVPFGKETGFTAIVDIDDAQMRELDAFAPATRRSMGYAN